MDNEVSIKICGLTRESDIKQVLSLGANYLGFIVYPKSPRALTLAQAATLSAPVPKGKRIIVDVETTLVDLERYKEAGFDYFQIHVDPTVDPHILKAYREIVGCDRLWLAPRLAPEVPFPKEFFTFAQTILLDTYAKDQVGGTGRTGDFARFAVLKKQFPDVDWVLAGGLNSSNIAGAVKESNALAVDANSGVESSPGVKDAKKLHAFFQALREPSFT